MKCPPKLAAESERLEALASHGLHNKKPLPSLDPVVRIAARMLGMPMAAVNIVGDDHVFFVAKTGLNADIDMSRDVPFCAHAIAQTGVMVIPDTLEDVRFHDSPLVTGSIGVRFYAGVPLFSPDGHPMGALCVLDAQPHKDFTSDDQERLHELARMASDRLELHRIETYSEQTRPSFEEYAGSSASPVAWFNDQGSIIAINAVAALLHGYHPSECIGRPLESLLSEHERLRLREGMKRATQTGSLEGIEIPTEVRGLRKDGTEFLMGLSLFCWRHKGHLRFEAVLKDLTVQRQEEADLRRLANIDALTGLANRACFYRRVQEVLLVPVPVAVLIVDVDGFKDLNDTLGPVVADAVLQKVAQLLATFAGHELHQAHLSEGPVAARLGGDEFALLCPGVDSLEAANLLAQQVLDSIQQTTLVEEHKLHLSACCGVALAPLHAHEALELVGNADLALHEAKRNGRAQSFVFAQALRMQAVARHLYGIELHRAVDQGEFVLFYQPLSDGSLAGAEALIRWQHPQRGLLTPAAFLPALENGPLASRVGTWVLNEACAQAAFWRRNGAPQLRMGINLFSAQFRVNDVVRDVIEALMRHGLPPNALELEVTENIVLDQDAVVLDALNRLRELGVGLSFDDFGTGYASLSLLTSYPITRIKIDRTFVQGMLTSKREASVVRAILDMACSLELEAIAEGIETEAQLESLRSEHCDEGQGYLFAKPMSAADFELAYGLGLKRLANRL